MMKEKRRNSEKRKQKSRDAARCRRSKETEIFTELAQCLPLPESLTTQLDKASIMRLAISLLKIGDVLDAVGIAEESLDSDSKALIIKKDKDLVEDDIEGKADCGIPDGHQMYLKAMEGMVFILSSDGDIVYLSENVVKYLGLQQIEVMGQSIYDYIHPCDHAEIREVLNMKNGNTQELPKPENGETSLVYGQVVNFSFRVKCTLTSKGRSVNLKSAPYKVMKCCGRLVSSGHQDVDNKASNSSRPYLLVMMEPIPHPSDIEVPLDSSTFLSKHEMDMHFVFCDERIEKLAGYDHKAMEGQSFFDFQHAMDSEAIKKTFKDLFFKGQAVTKAYRMLVANGGYIWLVTQATTINNSRSQKPESVVCVHYVLSGVVEKGAILSNVQETLALSAAAAVVTPPPSPAKTPMAPIQTSKLPPQLDLLPPKLELSTESIFTPRPKDQDKGFCKTSDWAPYVAGNPDDMSCLSPTAGEESIQLPFNSYNTDFLTMDKLPPQDAMKQEPGLLSPSQCSGKGIPSSPASLVSSAECSRIASPNDYLSCSIPLGMDSMDKFLSSLNPGDEDIDSGSMQPLGTVSVTISTDGLMGEELTDIDFASRAPYIPMDGDQDLDLLPPSSSTLFNLSKDDMNPSVFGCTEFVLGPKEALFEEPKPAPKMSVRDMLGESTVVASIERPAETMYLQMKRPLDMNCLEKGPPVSKVARLEESDVSPSPGQPCQTTEGNIVQVAESKNSVLLNLLLNGEDNNYGYKVSHKPQVINSTVKTKYNQLRNTFETLTNQDCEVNAPTRCYKLLQGQELLKALDR